MSIDGGNTFELLADFHDDVIKSTYHSFYTSDIIFISQSGKAYFTKAGEACACIGVGTAWARASKAWELGLVNQLALKSTTC